MIMHENSAYDPVRPLIIDNLKHRRQDNNYDGGGKGSSLLAPLQHVRYDYIYKYSYFFLPIIFQELNAHFNYPFLLRFSGGVFKKLLDT